MGWSDEEMRLRYRSSFVDTNPVNDYTFPLVALRAAARSRGCSSANTATTLIEDLRHPFFCVSANLTTGRRSSIARARVASALRASVAIPGVMPPVFRGDDVLVDGAAINNLPVDVMQRHAPGLVIGCDVGADHSSRERRCGGWTAAVEVLRRSRGGRRINIFQILMHAGMVNSVSSAAAQREPRGCHAQAAARERRSARLARIRSRDRGRLRLCAPRARGVSRTCRASPLGRRRTPCSSTSRSNWKDDSSERHRRLGGSLSWLASLSTHSSSAGLYSRDSARLRLPAEPCCPPPSARCESCETPARARRRSRSEIEISLAALTCAG